MTNPRRAARLRGHPPAVKGLRSLRDGLRPPLTAEPLWPLTGSNDGQASLPAATRDACGSRPGIS
jgi:hypothetical protein